MDHGAAAGLALALPFALALGAGAALAGAASSDFGVLERLRGLRFGAGAAGIS